MKSDIKNIKNKKVLITAGPTWVPIDNVRVISNISTGETGILLADKLQRLGAKVTLLLGPVNSCCLTKGVRLIRFNFFDELKRNIIEELKSKKYDIVMHLAAVSDYKPAKVYSYKVSSGFKDWRLDLVPTAKIINLIKKINRDLFLVGFKLEPRGTKESLIKEAKRLIQRANLDLAVANAIDKNKYRAYIVKRERVFGPLENRSRMADKLIGLIGEEAWKS